MDNQNKKILVMTLIISIIAFIGIAIPFGALKNKNKLSASVSDYYDDKYYYFNLEEYTNSLPSSTEEYDYMKVAFALQGLINREKPILFYHYKPSPYIYVNTFYMEDVWESVLVNNNNILAGKAKITLNSFDEVIQLAKDMGVVEGAVLWDPNVPATSNVASTIAGVENLVPIRKDLTNFSCYTDLVVNRGLFTVKRDLSSKFTGSGYLPDANLNVQTSGTSSSGSKKNDAYRWAKKYYQDTKKTSNKIMGYTRDAWIKPCSTGACFVDSWVPENMNPGEERQVYVTILNNNINSNETWTRSGNYRIASASSNGGHNDFTVTDALYGFEQGDSAYGVRLYLDPNNDISAGERYRVTFTIKAPSTAGTYHLNLGVVHDGQGWFNGTIDLTINVGSSSTANKKTEHYGTYPQGIFNAGLNTSDYLIANKAFFFDLSPDNSIAPIDDRSQTVGTDVTTLTSLLSQQKSNNNGDIFTVIGFVPWFVKYTSTSDSSSSMGDVAAEWKMIDYISTYNGQSDADAMSPVGLTNASLYRHQPLASNLTQNNDKEAIKSDAVVKEIYDSNTTYFLLFMGDYDCGAWTSGVLPTRFLNTTGNAKYPLTWPIASDLSDRVPQAFNWLYEHQERNDYFVAGDNGTGYLNPMKLDSNGRTTWKNHNITRNNQFDIDITGFLIGGNNTISNTIKSDYASISPVMVGYQGTLQTSGAVDSTPFIPSANIAPNTSTLAQDIYNQLDATSEKFIIIRTIQTSRADAYAAIDQVYSMAAANNKKFKLVDPYTMAQLYTDHPTKYKGCYTNGTNYQWVNATTIPNGYSYVDTVSTSTDCHKPRTKVTKPTMTTSSYIYTGSAITPTITGYDSATMNITGDTSKINIGNYSITISLKNATDYEWSDGSQNDIVFNWSLNKLTLTKPSINGTSSFTYDGTQKTLYVNNLDTNRINVTSDALSQTNAGSFSTKLVLKDKNNTSWLDGTTTDVTLNWSIEKAQLNKPSFNGESTFTYDGTQKTVSFNNYKSGKMTRTGDVTRTNAGTYPVTFALKDSDNYEWKDGTTSNVVLNWKINKLQVTKPTISGSTVFTYNGNYQGLVFNNLDNTKVDITGNNEVNVGSYTTTISLKDTTNYEWSDGTNNAQIHVWSISRANLDATVTMADYYENGTPSIPVLTGNSGNGTVTYTYTIKGQDNYSSNVPTTKGEYTVKAVIAETTNYNGQTVTSNFNVLESQEETIVLPTGSIITDVGLYGELIDSYNIEKGTSYNYTHLFTEEELASLKTLVISHDHYHGVEVLDLSNLDYLTGLENLTINFWEGCEINLLNLSKNTELKKLIINNVIDADAVNLSKNTKLKNLTVNNSTINILNISKSTLSNINLDKPKNIGYLMLDKGKDVSYLLNSSSSQDETINDNSFGITCDKYNLEINETTNCIVKGKTTVQMFGIIFKLLKNNNNITISDEHVVANLDGNLQYQLYGTVPIGEFNILSFKVTGVSSGSSKIYLDDYSQNNHKGYIDSIDYNYAEVEDEISKMIYVNKYAVTNTVGTLLTEGNLQTNYILKIVDNSGIYNSAFNIAILGDVKSDGIIDLRDVAKAYDGLANGNYTGYTSTEKYALDMNCDEKKSVLDIIKIYDAIK